MRITKEVKQFRMEHEQHHFPVQFAMLLFIVNALCHVYATSLQYTAITLPRMDASGRAAKIIEPRIGVNFSLESRPVNLKKCER